MSEPIAMILPCPRCGRLHVDKPEREKGWDNPPHKSHLCAFCGVIWRPADVETVGVDAIATRGKNDTWTPGDPRSDSRLSAYVGLPITEEWLHKVGFRWHQIERQPEKQWLLWLGCALHEHEHSRWLSTSTEDIGLQICSGAIEDRWFCWFRGDSSHRYHRFIHVRHLRFRDEVIALIEGIIGTNFVPERAWGGNLDCGRHFEWRRSQDSRFDNVLRRSTPRWSEIEKDGSRGGALPEHLEAAIEAGKAK